MSPSCPVRTEKEPRKRFTARLVVLAALAFAPPFDAMAQTYRGIRVDPPTLERLVREADFIGRVRCVTAGATIAEYAVLETWKGVAPDGLVRIALYGPPKDHSRFPVPAIALVGEQLIVCASRRTTACLRPMRDIVDFVDTLAWRDLPVDFQAVLGDGASFVSRDGTQVTGSLNWDVEDCRIERLRSRIDALLARGDQALPEERDPKWEPRSTPSPATEDQAALERTFRQLLQHAPVKKAEQADLFYTVLRFCALCPEPRTKYLGQLLESEEPFVQVAAAIHLGFEDRELGRVALLPRLELPGGAGVWAALALVQYGERAAIPRLLRVFDEGRSGMISGAFHEAMIARVLVALSNIGAASGTDIPRIDPRYLDRPAGCAIWFGPNSLAGPIRSPERQLRAWWDANCSTLRIVDPWAEELRARRVD